MVDGNATPGRILEVSTAWPTPRSLPVKRSLRSALNPATNPRFRAWSSRLVQTCDSGPGNLIKLTRDRERIVSSVTSPGAERRCSLVYIPRITRKTPGSAKAAVTRNVPSLAITGAPSSTMISWSGRNASFTLLGAPRQFCFTGAGRKQLPKLWTVDCPQQVVEREAMKRGEGSNERSPPSFVLSIFSLPRFSEVTGDGRTK